jgi:hypothetical protein
MKNNAGKKVFLFYSFWWLCVCAGGGVVLDPCLEVEILG